MSWFLQLCVIFFCHSSQISSYKKNNSLAFGNPHFMPAISAHAFCCIQVLSGDRRSPRGASEERDFANAEHILGISDIVSHFLPFLFSLDPALVYEVSVNLLSLADVPGGKPEWASAPITALLTLWDRQEYTAGRESIVRTVVKNLQLLDIHLQVSLFKRLLLMVRNLRVEADRMHALACICRTALIVDLFAKESVRRGQRPLQGTDIASLFEDVKIREDLASINSEGLFREELVACLVESCFQLSVPLPRMKPVGPESRVVGALNYGTASEAMSWTQSALKVVEVCRPCVKWDCQGKPFCTKTFSWSFCVWVQEANALWNFSSQT